MKTETKKIVPPKQQKSEKSALLRKVKRHTAEGWRRAMEKKHKS